MSLSSFDDLDFEMTEEMIAELTNGREERDDDEQPGD